MASSIACSRKWFISLMLLPRYSTPHSTSRSMLGWYTSRSTSSARFIRSELLQTTTSIWHAFM